MSCEQFENDLALLALGELEADRQAAVEAHLAGCPACRAKLADLRATLDLLNEAAACLPEAKLSAERRAALASAQPPASVLTPALSSSLIVRVAAAVLICLIGAMLLLPALGAARERSRRVSCMSNLGQVSKACTNYQEPSGDFFAAGRLAPFAPPAPVTAPVYTDNVKVFGCPSTSDKPSIDGLNRVTRSYEDYSDFRDVGGRVGGLEPGSAFMPAKSPAPAHSPQSLYPQYQATAKVFRLPSTEMQENLRRDSAPVVKPKREAEAKDQSGKMRGPAAMVDEQKAAESDRRGRDDTRELGHALVARELMNGAKKSKERATANEEGGANVMHMNGHVQWSETTHASEDAKAVTIWGADTDSFLWDAGARARKQDATTSTPHGEPAPAPVFKAGPVNPWVMASRDALSTFAVDVDTASYAIARNYIARGTLPPPDSVRMEEFVNAFDYNYPTQTSGVFSVYAEAGASPFRPGLTLLKVGVRARTLGRDARKPAQFTFVLDASGSMERPDRMPLVRSALKALLDQLEPFDRVSLVAFGTRPMLVLESAPVSEKGRIQAAVDGLRCGGSTNLHDGLKLGYEAAARAFRPGATNRVILCSDGVANIGGTEADEMLKSVEAFRRQGVALTVIGFGFGAYDDALLERLADRGDGSYLFVANEAEAQRIFAEQMSVALQPVALDAKIQVAFDPTRVRRYRLIGFENRVMAAADFRNDAVGGGAVSSGPAAGQSSTALYELELLPPADGEEKTDALGTVFVRYRDVESGKVEEVSSRLSADIVRSRTPQDSPRFVLAACAAEFAEVLRGSEHAKGSSIEQVRCALEPAAAQLPLDAQVQDFMMLVRRAQGLPKAQ